ncbi:ankyrin repeat-containing domain protein, partial [Ostreococcus tauri]
MASDDRTVDVVAEIERAHAFCGGGGDGDGGDALGRMRREHGAMYERMRSMLDEDAREARTRRRLRRALIAEFPKFDAYAIDVAVAWDDARCATLARGLVETPTAEVPFGDEKTPVVRAAEKGLKERLKFLHEHGYAWDAETCMYAAENGHLECLKFAHEHGCAWDERTCMYAARSGQLECLKYAHERGCAWNEETCDYAAGNGHLECLKYAHEHGCAWDEETCEYAVRNGHLECLKYAHERGCAWNEETCDYAAGNGHLECLKYAHEHGCAWDEETCERAADSGRRKREDRVENYWNCLSYAIDHQCPGYETSITLLRLERDAQAAEISFIVNLALSHARNGYIPEREYAELKAELK